MVLSAADARLFTTSTITVNDRLALQRDVDLAERAIRSAASKKLFTTIFDARSIGNPPSGDTSTSGELTDVQASFRDAFLEQGYVVTLDAATGFWRLTWDTMGVEELVAVYSIRTTVTPGAVQQQTVATIDGFFEAQTPTVTSKTSLVVVTAGGDTDETEFGAPASTYYEYIAVVRQQDSAVDYSSGVRSTLIAAGLGYTAEPINVAVYKVL